MAPRSLARSSAAFCTARSRAPSGSRSRHFSSMVGFFGGGGRSLAKLAIGASSSSSSTLHRSACSRDRTPRSATTKGSVPRGGRELRHRGTMSSMRRAIAAPSSSVISAWSGNEVRAPAVGHALSSSSRSTTSGLSTNPVASAAWSADAPIGGRASALALTRTRSLLSSWTRSESFTSPQNTDNYHAKQSRRSLGSRMMPR